MTLYNKIDQNDYLESLQKELLRKTGSQRFPKNKEVIDVFKLKDVYNIKSKNRTYLLERFENFDNREPVIIEGNPDITIEHIFPQNPDAKWKIELGTDEYNFIKENYLNTIGNLTLSGNNGRLGNKPFIFKRDLEKAGYKDSRLWLNKYLSIAEKWDKTEIERRFDLLAERFLKIWKYPAIEIDESVENNEINIFEADEPKHKKLEYAIFFDQKLEITQVSKLFLEVFKQLFELQPETFFTTDIAERISLTKNPEGDGLRQAQLINDTYYIETNFDSIGKFEKIKYALTIFDFEDELIVKYSE
jgi:hypothetical protein